MWKLWINFPKGLAIRHDKIWALVLLTKIFSKVQRDLEFRPILLLNTRFEVMEIGKKNLGTGYFES